MKEENKLKSEKGSITLFVLVAMMLMCFVVIGIYMNATNENANQMEELEKIKAEYEQEYKSIDEIYNDISTASVGIKFSNNGGEYAMPTEGTARIETGITTVTASEGIKIEKIYYSWTTTNREPTTWEGEIENEGIIEKRDCTLGEYYLWIRVVDDKGEETIVRSGVYRIREVEIKIEYNEEVTRGPLEVEIGYDNILTKGYKAGNGENETSAENGAKEVTVENNKAKISVDVNGYVYAEATDEMGNRVYKLEEITNIDREGPEIEIDPNGGEYELEYVWI